jgi:hypothetical protein
LFPLLEDFEGFLFDGCFAGAVAHLGELLLVGGELGIKLRQLDVDAFYACVDLGLLVCGWCCLVCVAYIGDGAVERRFGRAALGSE